MATTVVIVQTHAKPSVWLFITHSQWLNLILIGKTDSSCSGRKLHSAGGCWQLFTLRAKGKERGETNKETAWALRDKHDIGKAQIYREHFIQPGSHGK